MVRKTGYHHINEKDIRQIHQLKQYGLSTQKITDITGRANNIVALVLSVKTLEEYKIAQRKNSEKYSKKPSVQLASISTAVSKADVQKAVAKDTVVIVASEDIRTLVAVMKKIAFSLEEMEEHWRPIVDGKKKFGIF
jgi:hypothetical protein